MSHCHILNGTAEDDLGHAFGPLSVAPTTALARAMSTPPATSGRALVVALVVGTTVALMSSSVYPILIAPRRVERRDDEATRASGFKRRKVWDALERGGSR